MNLRKAIFAPGITAVIVLSVSLYAQENTGQQAGQKRSIAAERISLYTVPLVCKSAPELGCGSRAKPILQELERTSSVGEAWLNRRGTLMAIVWMAASTPDARAAALKSFLEKKHDLELQELSGEVRDSTLKSFLVGTGWYRGAAVDRLSEEEAVVIAARLVRRIEARTSLSAGQVKALQLAFASVFKGSFIDGSTQPGQTRQNQIENGLLNAGRKHLDEIGVAALQQAVAPGYRPLSNEK